MSLSHGTPGSPISSRLPTCAQCTCTHTCCRRLLLTFSLQAQANEVDHGAGVRRLATSRRTPCWPPPNHGRMAFVHVDSDRPATRRQEVVIDRGKVSWYRAGCAVLAAESSPRWPQCLSWPDAACLIASLLSLLFFFSPHQALSSWRFGSDPNATTEKPNP